ncbi:MAG: hypothetical protein L0209_05760, partial [candidate division Zixibacteria bacterium]|nr:hypothetical protein [candidate division Zixibacteria bacterium]
MQGLTVDHTLYVEPIKSGFRLSKVSEGPLAAIGRGATVWDEATAVRITCRGGVKGVLLGSPLPLKLDDKKPPIPCDWSYPNTDVWVNPRPDLPWIGPGPQDTSGYLPGGVVIAGGACPPGASAEDNELTEEENYFPSILIATRPLVYIPGGFPWPWGPRPWPRRWDWPWFPGKEEDDGDDPRDVGGPFIFGEEIDPDLTVKIKGCPCIRRPETEKYEAEPSQDGGSYQWSIDDEDIAEIEGPDNQKTVKLKSKDIGEAQLKVVYTLNGRGTQATQPISVIYHKFTERDRPRSEKLALPVIQPSPKVRIARQDPSHKHIETFIHEHRAKFEITFKGELIDALVVIDTLEVLAGADFRKKLSRSGNEYGVFDDASFEVYKAEVYGPGRSYVRMLACNSIEFFGSDTLEIVIRIPAHWERIIDSLESSRALFQNLGASQEEIDAYDRRLDTAWESALNGVEFEYAWLTHTDNSTVKAPSNEKWSIAVEVDAKTGIADIETSDDTQTIRLEEKQEKLLAPENEPKNYFLIHSNYEKDLLTWDEDGLLHHQPGADVNLIYAKEPCCAHSGPG